MDRLTKQEHWEAAHVTVGKQWGAAGQGQEGAEAQGAPPGRLKALRRRLLSGGLRGYMSDYSEHLLWEVLYERHLPKKQGAKLLEVGSAPGDNLVQMSRRFGYVPYGVDYSEAGAALNRKVFSDHGYDPENVFHADFFSDEFQERHRGAFDVVISRGFIEHFTDAKSVVDKHVNLLAEGGCLVISIPNLRGIYYGIESVFHRELISMHNLDIMRRERFRELFADERLSHDFCDFYGTFSLNIIGSREGTLRHRLLEFCKRLQFATNASARLLLRDRGAESGLTSPFLLFIGTKKA